MTRNLITPAQNTWCPGCGNLSLQHTLKDILAGFEKEGWSLDDVVLVSGIGCHAKIADYLNINSVYAIHGRTIPVATGIKLANPNLTVICCAGDGGHVRGRARSPDLCCQEKYRYHHDRRQQPGRRSHYGAGHPHVPAGIQGKIHAVGNNRYTRSTPWN